MRTQRHRRIAGCVLWGVLPLVFALVNTAGANGPKDGALAIGSSLGVSYIKAEGSNDGVTLIAIPNGPSLITASPGFRAAHVSAGRGFEFGIDFGLLYLNSGGTSSHDVIIGLDAAFFGAKQYDNNPFIGFEAGMHDLDFFGRGNQPYFGVAAGVRHIVGSDHGAAKFGVGYRRFVENSRDGLPGVNVIEVKVAFDLWIPR